MGEAAAEEKLEFRVLGTSAAFAGKNDACSSYLLTWRGRHYLIDAGPGSFSVLQNYIPYRDVSGIFLSHLHADHFSDIHSIRYAVYTAQKEGRMRKPIPLFTPRKPKKTFRYIRGAVREEFAVTHPGERLELDLEGMQVRFLRTEHPIETYAMKFTVPGALRDPGGSGARALVYTADTGFFTGLVRFCAGARTLIAEATLQNRDREIERLGHMTAERAGELAREAGAATLVLTHLWPEYERELSVQEAKRSFRGTIVLAERGLLLSV
jgi:ribonuclease BN (tRNA processing enzyme)